MAIFTSSKVFLISVCIFIILGISIWANTLIIMKHKCFFKCPIVCKALPGDPPTKIDPAKIMCSQKEASSTALKAYFGFFGALCLPYICWLCVVLNDSIESVAKQKK